MSTLPHASRFPPYDAARSSSRALASAAPSSVSDQRWSQLARFVDRAFLRRGEWRPGLRTAVCHVVLEMRLCGAPWSEVLGTLRHAISDHPTCARLDRDMLASGRPYSALLVAIVDGWVGAIQASEQEKPPV